MTDRQNMTRGYDDSISSVDEAARSVLGEDAGSNVDRLRRKFREQGWYERGLADYVEAEIIRRTQEPTTDVSRHLTVDEQGRATRTFPNAWFQGLHTAGSELKSTCTMAFLSVVTTTALYVGLLHPGVLVPATALSCFISLAALLSWIASVAKNASMGAAIRHIVSLATLFATVVFAVHGAERGHGVAVNSATGSFVVAVGMIVIGMYCAERLAGYSKSRGRKGTLEYTIASLLIMVVSYGGIFLWVNAAGS
jgi:hypothetical protein